MREESRCSERAQEHAPPAPATATAEALLERPNTEQRHSWGRAAVQITTVLFKGVCSTSGMKGDDGADTMALS